MSTNVMWYLYRSLFLLKKKNSCEYSYSQKIVFKCFHNLIGFFATYHKNFSWIINLLLDVLVCSITDCIFLLIFCVLTCPQYSAKS